MGVNITFKWSYFFQCKSDKPIRSEHCHDFHELIVFTEGLYHGQVGSESVTARQGDILLHRAGIVHAGENAAGYMPSFFVLEFYWDDLPDTWPTKMVDYDGRIRLLAQWLCERWWWGSPVEPVYPRGILQAIISEVYRITEEGVPTFIQDVRSYIDLHIHQPIGVSDLAAAMGMSRSAFSRRYRKVSGITPLHEIRRARVACAWRLLITTQLTLKEIADRVGLANRSSLAHLFRDYLNCTPGDIRAGKGKTRTENELFALGISRFPQIARR